MKLKAAQEAHGAAEATLADLKKQIDEHKKMLDGARKQAGGIDDEMRARLDRVQSLKADEERLAKQLDAQREKLRGIETEHETMQTKVQAVRAQFSDVTQIGGRLLSMSEAVNMLESRQQETTKSLKDAAEQELALQVKLNTLQETFARELARMEQIKKERGAAEAEFNKYANDLQAHADLLEKADQERRRQIMALEKRVQDLANVEQQGQTKVESTKKDLAALEKRKGEFARAEAQMRQWQEIEKRLRGQLIELEEKHEALRKGLPTDEGTVMIFGNDLIKRLDLIDVLIQRYVGAGGDTDQQLRTLRASFEDILHQHGVTEFEIAPGTEVDVAMRHRISIIDSVPGKAKPKVIESYRPGFIYTAPDGREVILRKVEVKTSSQ